MLYIEESNECKIGDWEQESLLEHSLGLVLIFIWNTLYNLKT